MRRSTDPKLDLAGQWLVKNGFPLTLKNWLELNYWREVKLSELDAEALAEIPDFLLPKKYRRNVE